MSSPMINTVIAFGCGLSLLFIPFLGIDNDEEVGTSSLCAVSSNGRFVENTQCLKL